MVHGGLALLAALVVGSLVATWSHHGANVAWEAQWEDAWFPVHEQVTRRVTFHNEHRLNAPLVQYWDFDTHGVPNRPFPYRVTWSADLHVPEGEAWRLRLLPVPRGGRLRLVVDGAEAPLQHGERLEPGAHPVELVLEATFREPTRLGIEVSRGPGIGWEPVPLRALSPPAGVMIPEGPAAFVALAVLLLGLALSWSSRDPALCARRLTHIGLVLIVLFGLGVRLVDYDVMPSFAENPDELFATWNGYSLLTDGETRGWSTWHQRYEDRVEVQPLSYFRERPMYVIQPYLEHPPLMHLLAGAAAKLGGAQQFTHARLRHTRLVPIALFVPSVLLLFAIARRLFPRGPAPLFGALLYAGLPTLVLQQRAVKEEQLLTTLALLGLYLFLRWDTDRRDRFIWWAGITTGLCASCKVPGAFFLPPLVLLFLLRGGMRSALLACAAGLVGLSVLFVYGALIDWDLFWFTTLHQASGRPAHWNLFPRFFADGIININTVGHGHTLFAWLAFAGGVTYTKGWRRAALTLPPLIYLAALALSAGNWMFGWYILPAMPFVCIGAGAFIAQAWRKPSLWAGLLIMGLLVMYGFNFMHGQHWARQPEAWPLLRALTTVFLLVVLPPFILADVFPSEAAKRVARGFIAAALLTFMVSTADFAIRYDVLFETHHEFDRDRHFDH